MIEQADKRDKPALFGAKAVAILVGILVGVYAVLALLAALDHAQRPRLEQIRNIRPGSNG